MEFVSVSRRISRICACAVKSFMYDVARLSTRILFLQLYQAFFLQLHSRNAVLHRHHHHHRQDYHHHHQQQHRHPLNIPDVRPHKHEQPTTAPRPASSTNTPGKPEVPDPKQNSAPNTDVCRVSNTTPDSYSPCMVNDKANKTPCSLKPRAKP